MAGQNDFQTWAEGTPGANLMTLANYIASTNRSNGVQVGIADETLHNRQFRQASSIASMIGAFIAAAGLNCLDDGNAATKLAAFEAALDLSIGVHGQCRFQLVTATQCQLIQFNGDQLIVNGLSQTVPQAGVNLSNAGLAASTYYYVYVFMSGGVMTLEAVTTGHSTAANGVETKSGDTTRTLIGAVFTNASSQFVDGQAQIGVLSWFSRKNKQALVAPVANAVTASTTPLEFPAARTNFICWQDEAVFATFFANVANNGAGNLNSSFLGIDGASVIAGTQLSATSATANALTLLANGVMHAAFAEGANHFVGLFGFVNAGTGTWNGSGGYGTGVMVRG